MIVFKNTTIVTVGPGESILYNAALVVDANRITDIGPTEDVLGRLGDIHNTAEIIDGHGKAILPGLINCHAHLTATLNRGITEDFGFPPDLNLPVQVQSLLSEEELNIMALLGALECIKSDNSTTVQNAGGIATYAKTLSKTGLRWVFAESGRDAVTPQGWRPGEDVHEFSDKLCDDALKRISDLFTSWHDTHDGLIRCFPAAALVETSSPALLEGVVSFAESHDLGYTIHLAQSRLEIESMKRLRGVRPTFYLFKHGFLGPRLFAAHCRYVDKSEIALLGNSKTIVTHQSAMAGNRGVIPPIPELRAAGCPIAMGTDNNTQDMVEAMRVALLTERISRDDGTNPQPEDILKETTMGGALAVRQQDQIGSLEIGKKADLFIIDTRKPHLVPTTRLVSSFIHNGQPGDIESLMVDGKFIMRDKKVLTIDECEVIAEADRIGLRAWNKLLDLYPSARFPTRIAPYLSQNPDQSHTNP